MNNSTEELLVQLRDDLARGKRTALTSLREAFELGRRSAPPTTIKMSGAGCSLVQRLELSVDPSRDPADVAEWLSRVLQGMTRAAK